MNATRATGIPAVLARAPMGTLTGRNAQAAYAHPRPQLARLNDAGLIHRIAAGYFVIVPPARIGTAWRPELEAAAGGIAAADFGRTGFVLIGLTAARIHRAVPRALAFATVAAPRRRADVRLDDRPATVRFIPADVEELDAVMTRTELGECLVTTPEQTVLDLAHRPGMGADEQQAREAIRLLLGRCDAAQLKRLAAGGHRRQAAYDRLRRDGFLEAHR